MEYKINKIQNVSRNCIVCGVESDASLKTRFYEIDYDGTKALVAEPSVEYFHQSYPNRMHGGIIGALLDETIGRAIQINDESLWGVTAELTVRYKKPVPLDEQIYVIGYLTRQGRRLFEGEGKIVLAKTGELLATATGKYMILPVEKICGENMLHEDWFLDPRPALEYITIPKSTT